MSERSIFLAALDILEPKDYLQDIRARIIDPASQRRSLPRSARSLTRLIRESGPFCRL
jgi:hypothetical protein